MRLYNAASCTPVDSNWETSQKLPPKPRSFVPVSSAKTSTVDATSDEVRRVQPSTANGAETRVSETYYYVNERRISPLHKQERKSKAIHNRNKSPHRRELKIESNPAFQYLAIRTSDVARYRENDVDTTLKRHASEGDFKDDGEHLGDKIQKDTTCGIESRKMKPPTEQPRLLKIPPIFGRSDHRTGVFCHDNVAMTKCHAKQQARLANCQDDVQDELKETQDSFATWATTRSMSNQDDCALTLPSLSVAKKERKSSRILNQNACLENKMRSKNSHETEAQNEHACSRATDTDDRIETSPPTYPARLSSSSHASTSPDYVAVLEAGMEEDVLMASGSNATASTGLGEEKDPAGSDNFDFFPLQSFVSVTKKEPSSGARLGVTSTFPSIKGTFARQSYGKMQDLSLEESKADDEAWASFSEETDKYLIDLPTQSNRNDELPFVFDIQRKQSDDDDDACFTALLANNNNGDGGNARKSEDLPYKTHGEARKALATRRPKLLGPLLEAQFSRSYCLRRKHSTKLADESLRGEGIPPISLSSSSAPPKNQSSSILDLYALRPTLNCMEEENNSFLGKEERWWESENKDVLPTSKKIANDDHAEKNRRVPKNSAVSPPTPSKRAIKNRLLEPRRLLECEKVLGVIALPMDDLMTAIDSADSSAGLSEGQILSLQALVPTPVEKAKLFEPPINATLEEGEEFMMQLIGIPQLEKKLEVLMFQIQFPKSIERFCQGLDLFQKACKEILTSPKLEKVLVIINTLGNRLVGKIAGKERGSRVSIKALKEMLDEVQSFSAVPKSNHSQPILSYALDRIERTNPSLLAFKGELPSLGAIARGSDWKSNVAELDRLETNLEDFRRFALTLPNNSLARNVDASSILAEDELAILESSEIGSVAVEFYLKMIGVYQAVNDTEAAFQQLCAHFGDDALGTDTVDIENIFETLARFCDSVGD